MFSRQKNPALVALLMCGLILAGIPIVPHAPAHQGAAIYSLDICHPAQALSAASSNCSLAAPSAISSLSEEMILGAAIVALALPLTVAADPPDTPPPRPASLL